MKSRPLSLVAQLLVVSMLGLSFPSHASLMPTQATVPVSVPSAERSRVQDFLAREDVAREIAAQGVDLALVNARVAAMSDDEVRALAKRIDSAPAAGDAGVIGVLFAIFIILLVTDILGLTKVFPFTRSVR